MERTWRLQFTIADLLAIFTLTGIVIALLRTNHDVAETTAAAILVGTFVGSVIGVAHGQLRCAVAAAIVGPLICAAMFLVIYPEEWNRFSNVILGNNLGTIILLTCVPFASVAAMWKRSVQDLFFWPSMHCGLAVAIPGTIGLATEIIGDLFFRVQGDSSSNMFDGVVLALMALVIFVAFAAVAGFLTGALGLLVRSAIQFFRSSERKVRDRH